jgi:hypothetical protein
MFKSIKLSASNKKTLRIPAPLAKSVNDGTDALTAASTHYLATPEQLRHFASNFRWLKRIGLPPIESSSYTLDIAKHDFDTYAQVYSLKTGQE